MPRAFLAILLFAACPASQKEDPEIDVCQVNIDCTLVQLDECCVRSTCDSDLRAETSGRTQQRIALCARKDCVSADKTCKSSKVRVGSFCRDGKCVLEKL